VHDKGTRLEMGLKTLALKTLKGLEQQITDKYS